ncbi:MAG: hypothetical protein L0332_21080 [Chloroflexi bacterium]|nr:hypothetical protein [Chloroflexota bacterium]MCI0578455.1 hypothetical protein [Chloroflexota bacterium]MCI0643901.1 hypothetical protein [Chloroflexota bacterium]MCI0729189.1 hypothetical protein [Chloroflexota bacterium]
MNPKLLVALVVLIVVFFCVGTGLGLAQDDESATDLNALVENLGNLLGKGQGVEAEDLDPDTPAVCRQQFEQALFLLPSGNACTLIIGDSSANIRTLSLQLRQGRSVRILLVQNGENGIAAEQFLQGSRPELDLQFPEEGGAAQISCADSGTAAACQVALER